MNSSSPAARAEVMDYAYRWLESSELRLLAGIDRSEHVDTRYVTTADGLVARHWGGRIPTWNDGPDGARSLAERIDFCRTHMASGAYALGSFTPDDQLAGAGVMQPEVEPGVAQLAYLVVSRPHRRYGVGRGLLERLTDRAVRSGAAEIYVSSISSAQAVDFYRAAGFAPTDRPIPALFAAEPDDIHMRLVIDRER